MKCLGCGHINRDGQSFCTQCGVALPVICKACRVVNQSGDRFCGGCGSELVLDSSKTAAGNHNARLTGQISQINEHPSSGDFEDEAERRPLTIMFTDLVGSTEMSLKLDAEDLREIIKSYQISCSRVIERYGGFIARYMGDGIMSYFGYPLAHENDTERAIRAGLDVVEAVRELDAKIGKEKGTQLEVRVGIAAGLVVVGDLIGEGTSEERAVVGETPNIAARMQGLADSNAVVIDPAARRLAGDAFEMRDLGLKEVRGSPDPMQVWQILAPHDTQSIFDTALKAQQGPLVGRTEELNQFNKKWKLASRGQGQVVILSGDAGIGKTRLIQAAYSSIVGDDTLRVRYQCSPLYTNSAFHPFIEQIERVANIDQSEHPDLKFKKVRDFLQRFAQDSAEYRALLARLLSIEPDGRYDELNLGSSQLKQRTISVLSEQLLALTDARPLLILFEDMHWADPSSLELLDSIVFQLKDTPSMLVCSQRSGHLERWNNLDYITSIELKRLDTINCEELIKRLLEESELPARLMREVLEKTDGIPLFVEEVIRALSANIEDAVTDSASSRKLVIPDTLQSSLMSRLDHLKSAKSVAQTGAAIGRQFHYNLLEAVVSLDSENLDAALDLLHNEAVVSRQGLPPDSLYVFRHSLIRDAAYQSLLRSKRREIHGRIAAALEQDFKSYWHSNPEILAHHLTEANETDKAIVYWEAAAHKAVEASANIEAEHHFQRAIELIHTLPVSSLRTKLELRLQTSMGAVLINNHGGGSPSVTNLYLRCRKLCEEIGLSDYEETSEEYFATLWGLWRSSVGDNLNVAMDLVEQMQTLGEREKRPDLIMQAHHSGWATLFNLGKLNQCLESLALGESLYDVTVHRDHSSLYGGHDPKVCADGMAALALCLRGFPHQASGRIERAIDFAKKLDHPGSIAHALDFAAVFDRICDRPDRCLESAETLVAYGTGHDFADYEVRGRALRGWALARLGDGKEGLAELLSSILAQRETGTSEDFSFFLEMLAEVYGLVGQPKDGLIAISEAWQCSNSNEAVFWSSATKRRQALLMVLSDADSIQDAIVCLREAASIAKEQQSCLLELQAALSLARFLKSMGKIIDARSTIEAAYEGMKEDLDLPVMVESREFIADCI